MVRLITVLWSVDHPAEPLARQAATALLGADPGPLHHVCPHCGSIGHGRPSFDAAVGISIARAPGLTVVGALLGGAVGVDVEAVGPRAGPRTSDELDRWVRREAVAKALGVGIVADQAASAPATWSGGIELPPGFVGAVAAVGTEFVNAPPEVRVAPARTANS